MSKMFLCVCILSGFFFNGLLALNLRDASLKPSLCRRIAQIEEMFFREIQQIQDLESACGTTDEVLWLYNDLGISCFFGENYKLALDCFDHILQQKSHDEKNLLIGAALWGKAICHACLDMSEEMIQDFQALELYFQQVFHYNCPSSRERLIFSSSNENFHYWDMFHSAKVEFANPNENVSAYECRERVRGSANALKLFIGPLVKNVAKRAIFMRFIDALEYQGMYCCHDGTIWATCVTPILQKLQDWKALGIPADPAWD